MSITVIHTPKFRTPDGKTFTTEEAALAHIEKNADLIEVFAYCEETGTTGRKAARFINVVKAMSKWRQAKAAA